MLPEANCHISSFLTIILYIYGLSQLIREPTRVTSVSNTIIDLCITNSPERVIHVGISDHSLVFLTRKAHCDRNGPRSVETRQFKHFDRNKFLSDHNQMPWANVHSDPNDMRREWKEMFLSCVDNHAPLKSKRVRRMQCPWITGELRCKTRRRDFLKKKAVFSSDSAAWDQYKRAINQGDTGAPNDQFVVKCIIIPQLMKILINVIKAFSGVFSVAGKTSSVPFSQKDTQEISQPDEIGWFPSQLIKFIMFPSQEFRALSKRPNKSDKTGTKQVFSASAITLTSRRMFVTTLWEREGVPFFFFFFF